MRVNQIREEQFLIIYHTHASWFETQMMSKSERDWMIERIRKEKVEEAETLKGSTRGQGKHEGYQKII